MQLDGVRPQPADDAAELLSARHPLLDPGAVPIDLQGRGVSDTLIITGPNTGGKTVSLKTLGLLALMPQAGLRIPPPRSPRLPVFGRVMADIGDEQSIAQSLSTFSSHLRNVVRFVAAAEPGTLSCSTRSVPAPIRPRGRRWRWRSSSGCSPREPPVAATTHYAELKAFAQEHELVTNASVAFDVATLRPTYRLEIGLPGKSQAFAIAQRLGFPAEILDDARSRLAAEHVSMEETLAAIGRAETERSLELDQLGERAEAEGERERARGVARARSEAAQMLADARRARTRSCRRGTGGGGGAP